MKIKGKSTIDAEAKQAKETAKTTVKRLQYQQIGKGDAMRDMEKLTLADYFMAGGRSLDHYNSVTLKKEVVLEDLKADELKTIVTAMLNRKLISKPEGSKNTDLIKAIKG